MPDPGPARIISECLDWLARAQDLSRTGDGGVARHFSLKDGWSASYPETTGYIVATLLNGAHEPSHEGSIERARRMLDWLVSIQFPDGGFQGGMVDQTPRVPVTFNTGQILLGLVAGATLDARYAKAAGAAADWLVTTQDVDGCWRRHPTPFAEFGEKAYETHVSLGLFAAHAAFPDRAYQASALKQVDWALTKQSPNGWVADCCLSDPSRPLTHTLGYFLRGVIGAHQSSGDQRYLTAACRTADGLLAQLSADGKLCGRFTSQWRSAANWVCLTGLSQIAESWFLLHKATGRSDYFDAARRANAFVRRTIRVGGPPEISGGVKGSLPVYGDYGKWQYLNWACKFTVDANRQELSLQAGNAPIPRSAA